MSAQNTTNKSEDESVKIETIKLFDPKCVPVENESLSLKSSYSECSNFCFEDCNNDHNDDQLNKNRILLIGEHANQILEGGEADLHTLKKNCMKNPGHLEFTPIESFSLEHLPEGYQDIDLYEYVKAAADLTVKLSVHITSRNRPDFWPNTKIPYFLSNLRGKKTLRTGSGKVWRVRKYTNEDEHRKHGCTTCPCDKCKASVKPSKVWWDIYVETAAHMVVDDIEASHTTMSLFYDREDSDVVILKDKVYVGDVDIKRDWCYLSCVTCDEILAIKLMRMERQFYDVWKKVYAKYRQFQEKDKFNFVVSHPHGCNKQVSFGQWKDMVQVGSDKDYCKITYTTCTCPGSSGAYVHCVCFGGWYCGLVHSGSLKSGLNSSSVKF